MEKKSNGLPKPYFVVKDASELPAIAQAIEEAEVIGLDLETTSLSPHHGEIRICSISFPDRSYVIDLFHTKTFEPVRAALHNSRCVKILHNAKFDQKWLLAKYKVELWPVFDTYKASALLYNGQGLGHNLYNVYERELNVKPAVEDMGDSRWAGAISDEQYMYAAEDVTYSHALREVLRKKLLDAGMSKVALLEFGAILPEAEMELNGIRLDTERWRELYARNLKASREMAIKLSTELPHPKGQVGLFGGSTNFSINSTQQLQQSLAYLGLDLTSTSEKELAMQAGDHPILREVIKYKKLSKKLTAFGLDYLEHVDSVTGRIHTNFFAFTEAGRYACLPVATRVTTNRGIIPIGEVKVGDIIQTPYGCNEITDVRASGKKELLRFSLGCGRFLVCTPTHRIFSNGEWKRAEDVAVNDSFYVSCVAGPGASNYLPVPRLDLIGRRSIEMPSFVEERLAFLMGHYIAEGCIGYNKQRTRSTKRAQTKRLEGERVPAKLILAFSPTEGDLRDYIERECVSIFKGCAGRKKEGNSPELVFNSIDMCLLFLLLGCGGFSKEKTVPELIFRSPLSVQASFLRGLFEGGGSAAGGAVTWCTDSRNLSDGVCSLLSAFGIHYSICRTPRLDGGVKNVVRLRAHANSVFQEFIGFWSSRKNEALRVMGEGDLASGVMWPKEEWRQEAYAYLKTSLGWSKPNKVQRRCWALCFRSRSITVSNLMFLKTHIPKSSELYSFILKSLDWCLHSSVVCKIDKLPEGDVVDIEVNNASSFLVDGLVVHNSSKPNLQQLPREKEFRDCFRPEPGGRFIISDYSQVELRAAAEISNDELLIGVYARGEDAHKQTAAIVNDVPLDKVTKGMRQLAKPINFGLIYGLGAEKLVIYAQTAYGVTMTLEEANAFRKKYFEGYSGIRRWHDTVRRRQVPQGVAYTLTGRRRYIAADESVNMYFNTPVQGSCADGLKTALREVYFGLKKFGGVARMVHMVHDEIIVESSSSDEELNKEIQKALEHGMVSAMGGILKNVPVEAEGGIGESWADK